MEEYCISGTCGASGDICESDTLRKEYKKVYSQNMELNSKMAELKEKNASLEAQIESAGEMSSSGEDSAKDSKTNSDN